MGGYANNTVYASTVLTTGDWCLAGDFTAIGSQPAFYMARWDGAAWSAIAGAQAFVAALVADPAGGMIALGPRTPTAVTTPVRRWSNGAWMTLASTIRNGAANGVIQCGMFDESGTLYIGGAFTNIQNVDAANVAAWDGATWSPVGTGLPHPVRHLASLPTGNLVAACDVGGTASNDALYIYREGAWSLLAEVDGNTGPLLMQSSGDMISMGTFLQCDGVVSRRIVRYDGQSFQSMGEGTGLDDYVHTMAIGPNGDLIVGGEFTIAGNQVARGIARWDGTQWHGYGSGIRQTASNAVRDLVVLPSGEIFIAGNFTALGDGTPAMNMARWDGQAWRSTGWNTGWGLDLDILPDGSVIAGGTQRVCVWRDGAWVQRSDEGTDSVCALPDNTFLTSGPYNVQVMRWTPDGWGILGDGTFALGSISALTRRGNGEIVVAGGFFLGNGQNIERTARFDGTMWHQMGAGLGQLGGLPTYPSIEVFASLRDGGLVAGGLFAASGSTPITNVAHWTGQGWAAFPGPSPNSRVNTAIELPDRGLAIGGVFTAVGSQPTTYLAIRRSGLPTITTPPSQVFACPGQTATLVAAANSATPMTSRWQKEAADLIDVPDSVQGSSTGTLQLLNLDTSRSGMYRCVVTNTCGQSATQAVLVYVDPCLTSCDADVNCDLALNGFDVEVQEKAVGGDVTDYCLSDPDFNGDFALDGFDVEAVQIVVGGGPCP